MGNCRCACTTTIRVPHLMQITAAAEPALLSAWQADANAPEPDADGSDDSEDEDELTTDVCKAKCSCWWQPRQPP